MAPRICWRAESTVERTLNNRPHETARPVVLDTNVVLDMLVFDDPFSRPLARALTAGELVAWVDPETLAEWEYVLSFPALKLEASSRQAVIARYRSFVRMACEERSFSPPALPRCRDRADQKFLVLAARVGAAWLVSKDKRVLSLADRHGLPFAILSPRQATRRLGAG